jgi:hypothetical protein
MQKTIVIEYNGQKIISQPFTFKHACIIDDARYNNAGIATGARNALLKMFEGTVLTDEAIDNLEIDIKILKQATNKIIDWFLGIDDEVKNS